MDRFHPIGSDRGRSELLPFIQRPWHANQGIHEAGMHRILCARSSQGPVSCLSFLESDFVMVNETMAEHYGITGVFTPRFVRVAAPNDRGGGVLAQAAVMLAQSNGQDAHAVNRGVWIRSRLLGDPPSDPPPDVASLPEPSSDAKARVPVSIKQRLDLHLKTGTTCYDCHKDIDPWGIATEGLDAVGLLRRTIKKAGPVVKKVTIDEQEIDGLLPLKKFLLEQRHKQFAYGFTRHMLSYALGRTLTFRDEQTVLAYAIGVRKKRIQNAEPDQSDCHVRRFQARFSNQRFKNDRSQNGQVAGGQ